MEIGTKVKVFAYHYNNKTLLGEGVYIGKEKRYTKFIHGVFPETTMAFKVNNMIISENDCDWEIIK